MSIAPSGCPLCWDHINGETQAAERYAELVAGLRKFVNNPAFKGRGRDPFYQWSFTRRGVVCRWCGSSITSGDSPEPRHTDGCPVPVIERAIAADDKGEKE